MNREELIKKYFDVDDDLKLMEAMEADKYDMKKHGDLKDYLLKHLKTWPSYWHHTIKSGSGDETRLEVCTGYECHNCSALEPVCSYLNDTLKDIDACASPVDSSCHLNITIQFNAKRQEYLDSVQEKKAKKKLESELDLDPESESESDSSSSSESDSETSD